MKTFPDYEHYDALTRPDVLEEELRYSDLRLVSLEGVQRNYPALGMRHASLRKYRVPAATRP